MRITRSVVYYPLSCAQLGQLGNTRSVVYYSIRCVLLGQLCIIRSVVYYSDLVSCQLCKIRSAVLCKTPSVVYSSVSYV